MIETLISSKTRIKLLLKFFLNSNTTAYLRSLESEFGESSNAIRLELNRLEEAGMLSSFLEGNKKMFRANTKHPLFREVHVILLKTIGLDQVIETIIDRLGEVEKIYLVGEFAKGLDSPIIDLIFCGNIDRNYLVGLAERAEDLVKRKIRYLTYQTQEFEQLQVGGFHNDALLLWSND
jgi:DNA-binding transcriptional ArsR family regulator